MKGQRRDYPLIKEVHRYPATKVLPGQVDISQDVIQDLLHKIERLRGQNKLRISPAKEFGIDDSSLFILDILDSTSVTVEDSSGAVYTFEFNPYRLDILAIYTSRTRTQWTSNIMILHDYKFNLYITKALSVFYANAPAQIKIQAKVHEVTEYLLNQILKNIFPHGCADSLDFDDLSLIVNEFISRYYYQISLKEFTLSKDSYWGIFERLFTPKKLYSYIHSRAVRKILNSGISLIHMIANLMEKIDTLARDPLSYTSSKRIDGLSLEQLDKVVPNSLLDDFLFPKHTVEKILSSLPENNFYSKIAQGLSSEFLAYLLVSHFSHIYKSRRALEDLKIVQYDVTAKLIRSGAYDFDTSRKIVNQEIGRFDYDSLDDKDEKLLQQDIATRLSNLFLFEFKKQLSQLFIDRKLDAASGTISLFDENTRFSDMLKTIRQDLFNKDTLSDLDKQIINDKIYNWSIFIDNMSKDILQRWLVWKRCSMEEINRLRQDISIPDKLKDNSQLNGLNKLLCYLFPRVYLEVPRFKDLRKPTIIFIHGGAGVGKTTVGNILAKKLGIPTYFRATITREVLRHFIPCFICEEIHRSSYQGKPTIDGFYDQSLRISKAIQANLDRAIKENTSVMIESGVLLPGTLPSKYYEKANIVEILLAAPSNMITHRRMLVGSVSLGKDRQKRLKNFHSIRLLDDVFKRLARKRHITIIDHKDVEHTIEEIMDKSLDPYADRWPGMIKDSIINKAKHLQEKKDQMLRDKYIRLPITSEEDRQRQALFSAQKGGILESVGQNDVRSLVNDHLRTLSETQAYLFELRAQEYRLFSYLLSQGDEPYDHIRQTLFYILNNSRNVTQLIDSLKELLYPALIANLSTELEQDGYIPEELLGKGSYKTLFHGLWDIPEVSAVHVEKYRSMVKKWEGDIESYSIDYFKCYSAWKEAYAKEEEELCEDHVIRKFISEGLDPKELHKFVSFYYSRFMEGADYLKGLDKPLIILITGSSGVGKSTIAKALKRRFNIPTSFSTDLIREDIRKLVPRDVWPEVHTSSFKLDEKVRQYIMQEYEKVRGTRKEKSFMEQWERKVLNHYYAHSLVILEGVQAAINRQIERNHSIIIEGVPLIPGALPARYYEDANIVQIVVTISDESQHLGRWDKRALEQPDRYKEGSKRYKEDFIPIRFINKRLEDMANITGVRVINNVDLNQSINTAIECVGGPRSDKFVFVEDEIRRDTCSYLACRSRRPLKIWGAWCTDIDDTVIPSGKLPTKDIMVSINNFIRALSSKKIAWIPMTGVSFEKIKPRLLDGIFPELREHVIFYGGDGSSKYLYNKKKEKWEKDISFERLLSDAQAIAIMGLNDFRKQLGIQLSMEKGVPADSEDIIEEVHERITTAKFELEKNGFDPTRGIIDDLKDVLKTHGFDPNKSETYYRGGSISWMMLGDIDAADYAKPKARKLREELLTFVDEKLQSFDYLKKLSPSKTRVIKPFPGARGIKFVLEGNSKERCIRDIIQTQGLLPEEIIFVGNEIFDGGNDSVVTNIKGIRLLSVGSKTAEGVVYGGFGIDANKKWYDLISDTLTDIPPDGGQTWVNLLSNIQNGGLKIEQPGFEYDHLLT